MNTWTPLWSGIVDSSIMEEEGDTVKVFIVMLASKDSDHICRLDAYKIGKKCNFRLTDGTVDEVKVLDILKVLSSPDTRRQMKQKFEGRRIKAVDGGWLLLNGEKYRTMIQDEMRKARLRKAQAKFREKQAAKNGEPQLKRGDPMGGETRNVILQENGATEQELDRHVDSMTPES